jgi:hypothetical protein
MSLLHFGVHRLHTIDKESGREFVHATFREGSGLATLWARKGFVDPCPQCEAVDTLLAVVVTAREQLWISVVVVADGTRDLPFQIFHAGVLSLGHSMVARQRGGGNWVGYFSLNNGVWLAITS